MEILSNQLTITIDWISFTVKEISSVNEVIEFLGFRMEQFVPLPKGRNGYKSALLLSGTTIVIAYDGNEDMGIHVDVSGSSISDLLDSYKETKLVDTPFGKAYDIDFDSTVLIQFVEDVCAIGKFTRIDLAVDDFGANYFSTTDLEEILKTGNYTSKFKHWRNECERTNTGTITGHTIYLGSRSSDIFLRVYDKKLEQNKKEDNNITSEWIRWELEIKGTQAISLSRLIQKGVPLGELTVGILSHYLRLINLDNENKSRCSTNLVWERFIAGISPLRLSVQRKETTIDDKKRWIRKQVAPTIAAIVIADGGSFEFFTEHLQDDVFRINSRTNAILEKERRCQNDNFRSI
jgi:phage replication initiation protein